MHITGTKTKALQEYARSVQKKRILVSRLQNMRRKDAENIACFHSKQRIYDAALTLPDAMSLTLSARDRDRRNVEGRLVLVALMRLAHSVCT
jgi:hypothetical protein